MLITFTWAPDTAPTGATADIDRVYLHIDAVHDHHDPDLHRMDRVDDRWESTVEVPDDLVASYRVMPLTTADAVVLDAAADSRSRWMTVVGHTVPHTLDHPGWRPPAPAEFFAAASGRLVMPDAPDQAGWDDDDTPEWTAASLAGRDVWTAGLPAGPDAPDHLLVLSDGRNWARTALPAALRRLHSHGRLPQVGVVAVDTVEGRYELLTRSAAYRELIADTVIPWAWAQAGRTPDPRRTVVAGESLGGLSAVDLVLTRPDAALSAVSSSGSFWFPAWDSEVAGGEVAAEIRERAAAGTLPEGIRVHLSAGTGEGRPGTGAVTMVDHSTAVRDALADAGVPVTCETGTHGHEMAAWAGALTRGLVALLD